MASACWLFVVAAALATVVAGAPSDPGDVRCFCNLPECIATGYMCKSTTSGSDGHSGCFSDFVDYVDVQQALHGCLELLDSARHEQCHNQPTSGAALPQRKSLLLCCQKDMCNHVDSPEIRLRFNNTFFGSTVNSSDGAHLYLSNGHNTGSGYNNEVWFKAATIAVPICGVVVLSMLITLAIKMLRKDSMEQRLFHQSRKPAGMFPHPGHTVGFCGRRISHEPLGFHSSGEMSSKKVPLLLQQHNEGASVNNGTTVVPPVSDQHCEKNEANAKLNFTNSSANRNHRDNYGLLVQPETHSLQISHFRKPNSTSNNLYRNVNLAVASAEPTPSGSKLYDKPQLNSVVSWGNAPEAASHV